MDYYDQTIIPLLHRMSNLEKLNLYLLIDNNDQRLIDGNELKTNIVNHMPLLNKFTFDIRSGILLHDVNHFPSDQSIRDTLKNFPNDKIVLYTDSFSNGQRVKCHLYTCPYRLNYYDEITNSFPGGIFQYVHRISLYDQRPFEHEFFICLQQSFPMVRKITINNRKPQKNKLSHRSNQQFSIVKYPHLIELELFQAHRDYAEEFLLDTKACLMNNVQLQMVYRSLKKVTHNFTRRNTQNNCSKMIFSYDLYIHKFPKHFKDYFGLQK